MKILHISTFSEGGAPIATMRLHQGLLNEGIDSKVLVREYKKVGKVNHFIYEENQFKKQINTSIQKYIYSKKRRLNHLPKAFESFDFPTTAFRLSKHPLVMEADIINLHWVSQFIDFPSFFTKVRKPIVWTLHDMNPFTGGYHYEEGFPLKAYNKILKRNLEIKKKALVSANLNIVALSRWLMEKSEMSVLFREFPHHLINNGIDTSIFKPMNKKLAKEIFGLDTTKKTILFVADKIQNKRKGFHYLLDALKLLSNEKLQLAIIGELNSPLISTHPIVKLGRILDERLMALAYNVADIFVIPSIEDNLPNTVLESISCSTPVVGFPVGGIPDMIIEEMNGIIAKKVDVDSLANGIKKAINFRFDTSKIRTDAVERFDLKVQSAKYLQLYKSLTQIT